MAGIPSDVNVLETLEHEWCTRRYGTSRYALYDDSTLIADAFSFSLLVGVGGLFTFDVLINLDVEMEYIWIPLWTFICAAVDPKKRPTLKLGSLLFDLMYLAQRYMPFIDRVILDSYRAISFGVLNRDYANLRMGVGGSILGIYLSELLLVLRIWAVWERTSNVGMILLVFALVCSVAAAIFFERFLEGIQCYELQIAPPAQNMGRCFCVIGNKDIYVCWVFLMVYNFMAIPAFRVFRRGGNSHLLKVVCRDGVLYYALIFIVSLINVIMILILPSDFILLLSPFERILHSILASHAILHIRKVAGVPIQTWNLSNVTMTNRGVDSTPSEIMFASSVIQSEDEGHERRSGSNPGERPFTSG
ncbi:hypothetical protein L218DRAFT_1004776 [Marasmius fiardii PR-910]|nr:hypothetical protein L218DRAFT_1004776 [Marasmius fiardii PR-910]